MNQLTQIFKLLSDETRLRIIVLLFQENLCVCELSGILNMAQPKISKSLSKLRDLDLVIDERKEKFVYYSLKKDNRILISIIKDIYDNMENYADLLLDRKRLSNKNNYH